ncbi:flagellar export chaperone FliS [Aneurinibacillus aneurinilyticus]|uniref:flagellar export chaperone FliS n=1 Tax=Aneurinibacillus aneurinilyticus TaxID=1391 RepID=UPI003524DAAC
MSMLAAQQRYQQNSVNTATPGELTLMLYKGGVRFLNAAKASLQQGNMQDANNYNLRVQDIVNELIVTLNRDYPLAEDLLRLYDYMLQRLRQANIEKDAEILDEVKGFFEEFVGTWTEALKLAKQK